MIGAELSHDEASPIWDTESNLMSEATPVPRLLAIDDSELIHRLLQVRLQGERLELHSALSASEGIRLAQELLPEVILLDIELDEIDGFEVLSRLKQDPRTHDIAVIFISAASDTMDRVRGLDLGAVDFIAKPFEVVELKARVRLALRMRHLVKMLEHRAQIDGLSGLWNRRYFDQRLSQEFSEARRHGRPLSLIMCDVDRFKRLNDQFGHPFGDHVIERVAQVLLGGRGSDIACRYGGEEFSMILPSTTATHAQEVAERKRVMIESQSWTGHPDLVVTASFGIADLQRMPANATMEQLIQSADAALYRAKQQGRNRIEIA
ncbi:MAG: diguanylate cyclase [Planctomycetes bacterium]|nr:diguanylate cyclase [Planctomycetota bacterium]